MKTAVVYSQQRWEFSSLVRKTEPTLVIDLNLLGQEGWELVTAIHDRDNKGELCWTTYLKRPSSGAPKAVPMDGHAAAGAGAATNAAPGPSGTRQAHNPSGFDLSGDTFEIKKE
jgi:hypothetical protein